jgi:predicted ribosomally synthesized peptide with SipW-like signal peptide
MKKKSLICTILAMTLILAGIGYAYWTDTLQVNTKATTGDLDVTFVDLGLYAQYGSDELVNGSDWSIIDGVGDNGYVDAQYFRRGTDYNKIAADGTIDNYHKQAEGYNDVSFDASLKDSKEIGKQIRDYNAQVLGSDEIEISVNNMYPGYAQAFRSDILNLGSIAARLSKLQFDVNGIDGKEETAKDMLGVALLIQREYYKGNNDHEHVFGLAESLGLDPSDIFTVGNVDFVRLSALDKVSEEVLKENAELLSLPSGNSMDLFLGIGMDPDAEGVYTTGSTKVMADNDDTQSQNTGATVNVKLMWDQFNEGRDINSTNRLAEQNAR